ncbi:MAG TPA: GNAT family N-acetyltransferase, partial [Sphingobacteriaceae bacterium]
HQLAEAIWWPTYQPILSSEQISFMLEKMYSEEALADQMLVEGMNFLIVEQENQPVGFAAYSLTDTENQVYKIHKLYVLPDQQGKGTGRMLINYMATVAGTEGGKILELNVNRGNPAFNFYKKIGFTVHQEVDIPYYQFVLNDYILRKPI